MAVLGLCRPAWHALCFIFGRSYRKQLIGRPLVDVLLCSRKAEVGSFISRADLTLTSSPILGPSGGLENRVVPLTPFLYQPWPAPSTSWHTRSPANGLVRA